MGLKKGMTNNPNGRKKGVPNKTTAEVKETISRFVSNNIDDIQDTYDKLEPRDKVIFLDKMLKYIIPVQTKSDITVSDNGSMDNITFVIKGRD